jgi:hypothetical protein
MTSEGDRPVHEVIEDLVELRFEIGTLAARIVHFRPGFRDLLSRRRLAALEASHEEMMKRFVTLDGDLTTVARAWLDPNTPVLRSINMQLHFGIRDSVRELLTDTSSMLGGIRNQLDFRGSLLVALVALVISLISAGVDLYTALTKGGA